MTVVQWIGEALMVSGVVVMAVGLFGLLRYPDLFARILIASKVDTLGMLLILSGAVLRVGLTLHAAKILLILVFALVTGPMVSHAIARSAYTSGRRPESPTGRRRRRD